MELNKDMEIQTME